MADTDLPKDAANILQKAADQTRNTGKVYEMTADEVKKLAKTFNKMQDAASSASNEIRKSKTTVDDATDSFTHFQEKLIMVGNAFENPKRTLRSFADSASMTADDLMKMYSAIGGLVFNKPIKDATKSVQDLENQLKELQDLEAKANPVKALEENIKKEEELCKKTTACDKDKLKSLQDQLSKGKDLNKLGGSLSDIEKDRLKTLREKKPQLEKELDLAKGHLATLEGLKGGYQKLLAIFGDAFDRFVELDKAAEDFRNETGLNKTQMKDVETAARQVNQELAGFGVSIKDSYKAAQALGEQFGSIQNVSKEQIKTVALLNVNLGVTEDNAAGFLQKMESVGGLTEQQASGMAGLAANAATAAGVPLNKVMHDVANASDTTLAMMKGNVRQMTLAAIQAQRMGVNLEKTANSARGLLNFQESVDAEMEVSVLLGKNLNLNYARQLSFQGDIAGAQKEIVNQVRSMGEFNKMNVFQQEALAKATGYSVADLSKMLKNEEKLSKLKPEQRKAYEDATTALKEQTEETGLQMLQQAQMQGTMSQLSNTFKAFKQSAADALTPLVMIATKILVPVLKGALMLFNLILAPVKLFANLLYKLWEDWGLGTLMDAVSKTMDTWIGYIETFSQWTSNAEGKAGTLLTVIKLIGAAIGAWMVYMYLFPKAISGIKGAFTGVKSLLGGELKLPSFGKAKLPSFGKAKLPSFGTEGMDKVGETFKKLKTVIKDVIDSILNTIKKTGKVISEFVSDLAKGIGSAIQSLAKGIGSAVESIASGVGSGIASLAKGIGSALGSLGTGIGAALKGIGNGLRTFADPTVAAGLAVVTLAIIALGIGIGIALRIAAPAIKILADMFVQLAPFVVAVFVPAIDAVKEVVLKLVDVLGGIFMTVINAVKEIIIAVAKVIGGVFITAINAVKEVIVAVAKVIGGVFITAINAVKEVIVAVANVIGGVFMAAINAVKEVIIAVAKVIGGVFITAINAVKEVIIAVANIISGVFITAINAVKEVIIAVAKVIGGVFITAINAVKEIIVAVANIISGVFITAINAVKEVVLKLVDVIGGILISAINAVKEAILAISKAFSGVFMTAINAVKEIIITVANIISGVFIRVIDKVGDTILKVAQVIGGVFITGLTIMRDIFNSLPDTIRSVAKSLSDIASSAPGIGLAALAIAGLGVALTVMSAALGGGLIGGVTGLFSGDPIEKLGDLNKVLQKLATAGPGIQSVGSGMSAMFSQFSELDVYNEKLLTFSSILKDISKINLNNLTGLNLLSLAENTVFSGIPDVNQVTTNEDTKLEETNDLPVINEQIVSKLDELISLMSNGGIGVYLDGRKVSEQLAIASS